MKLIKRLWPASLKGQVLLAIALALLFAQALSTVLLYQAQHARNESALLHTAAFRVISATRGMPLPDPAQFLPPPSERHRPFPEHGDGFRVRRQAESPLLPGETRLDHGEHELREMLNEQDIAVRDVIVVRRHIDGDPQARRRLERLDLHRMGIPPSEVVVVGVQLQNAPDWIVARVFIPQNEQLMLRTLILQTLFIYAVLFGAMALILRRITRPLAVLTGRLERFAETRDPRDPMEPEGPEDIRRLITAHNAMEARIMALLDEKDVMLGAIGHDLKTPLAALRVRIESVENETERGRMARTIEDITRTLDDILSLARVGRPSDPAEPTELSALVASVVEEYEDMNEPVVLTDSPRLVLPIRPTWLRRALRNLIGNGLRYGQRVTVDLERVDDTARIRIADQGPGIPEGRIAAMLEPFTRGDPSRNSETGGAGLGLTLARAVAEQHGGTLTLTNRRTPDGHVAGLDAVLTLPLNG